LEDPPRPAAGAQAFPDTFSHWPRRCYREAQERCSAIPCVQRSSDPARRDASSLLGDARSLPGEREPRSRDSPAGAEKGGFVGLLAHPEGHNRVIGPRKDYTAQCATSVEHEFIYMHVMKSGGSSFHTFLRAALCSPTEMDKKGRPVCDSRVLEFTGCKRAFAAHPDFFRFSFVRHPFSRAISCWDMAMRPSFRRGDPVAFSEWAKDPANLKTRLISMHWQPQAFFLINKQGCPLADFVGLLDPSRFLRDLQAALEWIGSKELLDYFQERGFPRENSAKDRKVPDEEARTMTLETKQALFERYAEDFAAFGFSISDPRYGANATVRVSIL